MTRRNPGVRRRGVNWYIRYYDLRGHLREEKVGPSYHRALRARAMRLADVETGRFGLRRSRKALTFREFVEGPWRQEVIIGLKPSTKDGYDWCLKHLLPAFGNWPLTTITRAAVKTFIAKKARQQKQSRSVKNPNPNRPTLSYKSIRNIVACLRAIMESAAMDYELLPGSINPLAAILRRRNFPPDLRPWAKKDEARVLEPEDFKRAICYLEPPVLDMVLVSSLAGVRWGELIGIDVHEDVDFRRNKLSISRALYKRVPQTPKTRESIREIDMCPTVRRIFKERLRQSGLAFSVDGQKPLLQGPWIKRHWLKAQRAAGIKRPIRWHDCRHQFVSLLIAAGKHPKYISSQAGHADPGFTMKRYGHLFDTIKITPMEWWDDLLWPAGCPHIAHKTDGKSQIQTGEQPIDESAPTPVNKGRQQ